MWEYFVTEYEYAINKNNYICDYVRKFSNFSEIPNSSGGIDYIRLQLTDRLPTIEIKYKTTGNKKYFDKWIESNGIMKFYPLIEEFNQSDFKKIMKLIQRSEYSNEKTLETIECIEIQIDCYLWYLQAVKNVRRYMIDYLESGNIDTKKFKRNIEILKRTFNRYKKIKDKAVKIKSEFEEMVCDKI